MTRPSPDSAALRLAFTRTEQRTQRKSDGTVVIEGRRFELPNRYRHLTSIEVRFASWDLTTVHLVDARTGNGAVPALSPGQDQKRQRAAPAARPGLGRARHRQTVTRHRAAARQTDRPAGRDRIAAAYLPKDEGDDT